MSELGKLNKKDIRTTGVKNADELKQRYLLGHDYKEEIETSEKKIMASLEEKTEGLKELAFEQAPLSVSKGGTGATSFPSNSFLLGNGTSALQAKTADEVVTLLGAVEKPVLLWENASPTSSFAEQTVSLNLSAYDFFLVAVLAASNNSNTSYNIGAKSPLNYSDGNSCLAAESYDMHAYRRAKFYDDRIEFYSANKFSSSNAGGDNSKAIPYKIWGFKQ